MSIKTFFLTLSTIPAKLLGAKIGKNSFFSPGYDIFGINLKGLTLKKNIWIGRNAWISIIGKKGRITIGNGTNISRYCMISCVKNIEIGNKCLISHSVSILDHDHIVDNPNVSPMDSGLTKGQDILIEDNCFIGAGSFILKGVNLGRHCVVGANSVVTKSFPKNSIIAGNPAKLIRKLNEKR